MSFLGGVFSTRTDAAGLERRVDTQMRVMRGDHLGLREHRHCGAALAVGLLETGVFENGPQPATSDDGRYALFLNGELFNCDELAKGIRPPADARQLTPPGICLRYILEHGVAGLRRLDGQFTIAFHDAHERRLQLISDRFGYRPLFYAEGPEDLTFATTLRGVRAGRGGVAAIDRLATAELFAYGTHVFDRSWIEGHLRLPPATAMTVDPAGVRLERYWEYAFDESAPVLDQPTYYTVSAKLLDRAVERRMKGSARIGIFLSGGYDSRAVVAAIQSYHLPIPSFTFGVPESRDVRFAAQLAERLGLEHERLHRTEPHLARYCRMISERNEGLVPFIENTSPMHHDRIKAKADVILTGFLGEYSGSHTWPRLLLTRSREQAIPVIFDRLMGDRPQLCRRLFRAGFWDEAFGEIRSRFESSFDTLSNSHPLDLSDAWDYTFRHPWSYQAAAVDRPVLETRAPMLDIDLTEFQLSIPWRSRLEQRVYKAAIAYSYPQVRDIPCTNSARPIDPKFGREYAKMVARFVTRRAIEPIRSRLTRSRPLGRDLYDQAESFRAEPELRSQVLEPMLDDGTFDPSVFDLDQIRAMTEEHFDRHARHEMILSRLISWGLAKRLLVDGDAARREAPVTEEL